MPIAPEDSALGYANRSSRAGSLRPVAEQTSALPR